MPPPTAAAPPRWARTRRPFAADSAAASPRAPAYPISSIWGWPSGKSWTTARPTWFQPIGWAAVFPPASTRSRRTRSDFSSDDRQLQMRYTGSTIGSDYLPGYSIRPTSRSRSYGVTAAAIKAPGITLPRRTSPSPASRERGATSISRRRLTIPSTSALSTDPVADLGLNIQISDTGAFHTNQIVTNFRGSLKGNGAGRLAAI